VILNVPFGCSSNDDDIYSLSEKGDYITSLKVCPPERFSNRGEEFVAPQNYIYSLPPTWVSMLEEYMNGLKKERMYEFLNKIYSEKEKGYEAEDKEGWDEAMRVFDNSLVPQFPGDKEDELINKIFGALGGEEESQSTFLSELYNDDDGEFFSSCEHDVFIDSGKHSCNWDNYDGKECVNFSNSDYDNDIEF
jgi:hypothetical protein